MVFDPDAPKIKRNDDSDSEEFDDYSDEQRKIEFLIHRSKILIEVNYNEIVLNDGYKPYNYYDELMKLEDTEDKTFSNFNTFKEYVNSILSNSRYELSEEDFKKKKKKP